MAGAAQVRHIQADGSRANLLAEVPSLKVVLFCGGLGMRIRDSENLPKPMIHIDIVLNNLCGTAATTVWI